MTTRIYNLQLVLIAAATAVALSSTASAVNVVVSPGNEGDWGFYSTDGTGTINAGTAPADLVNGPGSPPVGTGSAHLQTGPGAGDGSAQLRNDAYAGTRLDALTSLSYSTYVTSYNGSQAPYLTLWLDTDNNGSRDDRLWFEPTYSDGGYANGNPNPQPAVTTGQWQTWDVLLGMVFNDNGPSGPGANAITFSDYLTANPDATIVNDAGQSIGGIRIASGFASPGDNYDTNVDNFTIGTSSGTVTYDFEATAVPEPASFALAGLALLGAVAARRRFARS